MSTNAPILTAAPVRVLIVHSETGRQRYDCTVGGLFGATAGWQTHSLPRTMLHLPSSLQLHFKPLDFAVFVSIRPSQIIHTWLIPNVPAAIREVQGTKTLFVITVNDNQTIKSSKSFNLFSDAHYQPAKYSTCCIGRNAGAAIKLNERGRYLCAICSSDAAINRRIGVSFCCEQITITITITTYAARGCTVASSAVHELPPRLFCSNLVSLESRYGMNDDGRAGSSAITTCTAPAVTHPHV